MKSYHIPVFTRLKVMPLPPSPAQDKRVRIPAADVLAMRRMKDEGKTVKQVALEFPQYGAGYVGEVLRGTARKNVKGNA